MKSLFAGRKAIRLTLMAATLAAFGVLLAVTNTGSASANGGTPEGCTFPVANPFGSNPVNVMACTTQQVVTDVDVNVEEVATADTDVAVTSNSQLIILSTETLTKSCAIGNKGGVGYQTTTGYTGYTETTTTTTSSTPMHYTQTTTTTTTTNTVVTYYKGNSNDPGSILGSPVIVGTDVQVDVDVQEWDDTVVVSDVQVSDTAVSSWHDGWGKCYDPSKKA